ncbi:MAG TPA: helix-turn-helix transcriptional regulator [Geobacteraceae bacterium]|nr:helix-turn-helix transcriptional regulator [Geobacteraceae bacterium]
MMQKILSPEGLGAALRSERKKRKQSQTAVGKAVGVDQPTVSKVEKGNPGTEIGTLFRLLAALELELVIQPRQKPAKDTKGDIW